MSGGLMCPLAQDINPNAAGYFNNRHRLHLGLQGTNLEQFFHPLQSRVEADLNAFKGRGTIIYHFSLTYRQI